jgi:hypothetical protein
MATSVVGCALCGYQPHESEISAEMRILGTEPVSLMVCADHVQCVTRFEGSARASTGDTVDTVDGTPKRSKLRRSRA